MREDFAEEGIWIRPDEWMNESEIRTETTEIIPRPRSLRWPLYNTARCTIRLTLRRITR